MNLQKQNHSSTDGNTVQTFYDIKPGQPFYFHRKGLHIASLNIQHVFPKLDEIRDILNDDNISLDIFGLNETFLTENVSSKDLLINGYNVERKDRLSKGGGGLLMYINSCISYTRRYDIESSNLESMWVQIETFHKKSVLLNLVYRPPNSPQSWIDDYEKQLCVAESCTGEFFAMGDYNIDFTFPDCFNNTKWTCLIKDFGLRQYVESPTRVTKSSATIIDHIYSSSTSSISETFVSPLSISDHYPIAFTIGGECTSSNIAKEHTIIKYRSFKNFDLDAFKNNLHMSNISAVEIIDDPNSALDLLYKILNLSLQKHAPVKSKRIKRKHQPGWFSDEIKQARIIRDKHKYKKEWDLYKTWRNKCIALIKKNKKTFFNDAVKSNKSPKYLWDNIKELSNATKQPVTVPITLESEGVILDNKQQVVEELNRHFINIARVIEKSNFVADNFISLKQYADAKLKNVYFNIDLINPLEVSILINKLNSNKACGLDKIGPNILKMCKDELSSPLASIINNIISSGIFPEKLKSAGVIPIHKGGSTSDPNNYRPISLLPTLSKIIERHVANQLYVFMEKTGIINHHQSGFRKHHSCQTALIRIVDSWLSAMDDGNLIGTVFLDFKKAFDLVDHKILLYKLKLYHFSKGALNFFESYLSNRTQIVTTNGINSSELVVTSGVPQGSILGPLLFLFYVNDLSLELSSETDMYADDTTLHIKGRNKDYIQSKLQLDLFKTQEWCIKNNMAINPTKTTCMIIGSRYKLKTVNDLTLHINDEKITNVECQKLLGIHIDNKLTWTYHIDKVCKKLVSKLYLLKRIQYFLTPEMKQLYYNAYITPSFDYGCITWHTANKSAINRVVKLQKRIARTIYGGEKFTSTALIFKHYKWLPFLSRCKYFISLLVYKSAHNLTPLYINELVTFSTSKTYALRSQTRRDITHRKAKTSYLQKTFSYSSMEIWNQVPIEIRNASTLNNFKSQLKAFLLETEF